MPLNTPVFIFGNLAPDLCFSFLFHKHNHTESAASLAKLLKRLYDGDIAFNEAMFSFYLGMATHYVCDFLCYPHSPAFKGGLREHVIYERKQTVNSDDMLPFYKQKSKNLSLAKLIEKLDGHISRREQLFSQNVGLTNCDIPLAMYVATWVASCAYLHAEKLAAENFTNMHGNETLAMEMAL